MAKPQVVVAPVLMSKLSANAPEFYPSGYSNYTVSTALPQLGVPKCEGCPNAPANVLPTSLSSTPAFSVRHTKT